MKPTRDRPGSFTGGKGGGGKALGDTYKKRSPRVVCGEKGGRSPQPELDEWCKHFCSE